MQTINKYNIHENIIVRMSALVIPHGIISVL